MDFINNYQGGGPGPREKEITKILSTKYPKLIEDGLLTKSGRFKKNKEEDAREYITDPNDEKLLDEYIDVFFTRQAKEGKAAPEKYKKDKAEPKSHKKKAEPKSPKKKPEPKSPKKKPEPKSPKKKPEPKSPKKKPEPKSPKKKAEPKSPKKKAEPKSPKKKAEPKSPKKKAEPKSPKKKVNNNSAPELNKKLTKKDLEDIEKIEKLVNKDKYPIKQEKNISEPEPKSAPDKVDLNKKNTKKDIDKIKKIVEKDKKAEEKKQKQKEKEEEKKQKQKEKEKEKKRKEEEKEKEKLNVRISPELFLFLKENFKGNIQGKPTTYITLRRLDELNDEEDINKDLLKETRILHRKAKKDIKNELRYIYPTKEEIDVFTKEKVKEEESDDEEKVQESDEDEGEKSDEETPDDKEETCHPTIFTKENQKKILDDGFVNEFADEEDNSEEKMKESENFELISTNPDGNCGYHGILQGLFETYYLLGNKCNKNLKDFVEKIKVDHNILKIIIENREKGYISIPRKIINEFRQFLLDIEYFDDDKDTEEIRKSISGGINNSKKSIDRDYYINELVIAAITEIFEIPIFCFLEKRDQETKKITAIINPSRDNIFGAGHVIFMFNENDPKSVGHFTILTTTLQDYDKNIMNCLLSKQNLEESEEEQEEEEPTPEEEESEKEESEEDEEEEGEDEPKPEKAESEEGEDEDPKEKSDLDDILKYKDKKYVIESRKAFVDFINEEFFVELIEKAKDIDEVQNVKLHQLFSKEYLSEDSPYRGLLIYHGLGTGKTATSIVTVEGLSEKKKINVLLPASLENEYINEIKRWGQDNFNIDRNPWIFVPLEKLLKDRKKYGITSEIVTSIQKIAIANCNKDINISFDFESDDIEKLKAIIKEKRDAIREISGIYMIPEDLSTEKEIFVSSKFDRELEKFTGTKKTFSEIEDYFINSQIEYFIQEKYNFIHYNGWPNILKQKEIEENADIEMFLNPEQSAKRLTKNQTIAKDLIKKVNENEKLGINSPFKDEVIVIDEVHNLINMINNKKPIATQFYNWIKDSIDTKLVFLSGTPIVNEPCEIAILFNMLKGRQEIYNYTIKEDKDIIQLENELKQIFFTNNSTIEQFYILKKRGRTVISFIRNKTNFSSILDKETNVIKTIKFNNTDKKAFFKEISDGLEKIFRKKDITPSQEDINKNIKEFDNKKFIFDKDTDIIFNVKQNLFDLILDNDKIDLTDNYNFMDYFFDENLQMPNEKKVFLRRLLMGLTSYYPIGKTSIVDMPQIVDAEQLDRYKEYTISDNINIIPSIQSSIQWTKYEETYKKDKLKSLKRFSKNNLYDDNNSDFNIRNRQNCNIVYENDDFKYKKSESKKLETYKYMSESGMLLKENVKMYSPKFYNILKNSEKYLDSDGNPTGKIMYYSDFRQESGSEIFEEILKANGYEKFDHTKGSVEEMNGSDKKKRYTFITGSEGAPERKANKESYNHIKNLRGEYIQVILISSAGAEGISLFGVRQVHIMEPFWNFGRINQVFGRAIRFKSHKDFEDEKDRTVEQYLYLSFLPEGDSIETIFKSIKQNEELWPAVKDIDITDNIEQNLLEKYPEVYNSINKILSVKIETDDRTIDQMMFDIMERKNKISMLITDIIKESSVDCIQNSRDDFTLNQKCLRFSEKLLSENTIFPGVTAETMNTIDTRQLKTNFIQKIGSNIFIISAKQDKDYIYIYYELYDNRDKPDIRYIRENGKRLCDINLDTNKVFFYENKKHSMNKEIGPKFSIFQTTYKISPQILEEINEDPENIKFPEMNILVDEKNIHGYSIKYNVNERLFYRFVEDKIIRLYDYKTIETLKFRREEDYESIIIHKGKFYLSK